MATRVVCELSHLWDIEMYTNKKCKHKKCYFEVGMDVETTKYI